LVVGETGVLSPGNPGSEIRWMKEKPCEGVRIDVDAKEAHFDIMA
jgi:hypothetical protein